jgi:hypothetical protein
MQALFPQLRRISKPNLRLMPDSAHVAVIYPRVVGFVRLDRYPPYRSALVPVDHPEPGYSLPPVMPMSSQDSRAGANPFAARHGLVLAVAKGDFSCRDQAVLPALPDLPWYFRSSGSMFAT